ncbi:hypothetical protein [Clostridium oceanicum]|uniref:Uncharacterized protein n=1 Tax=Clostridium oceanicum TaxID=1543 RepID=A0ABP3UMD2_9CLOT
MQNDRLKAAMMETVEKQITNEDTKYVKEVYEKLVKRGHKESIAKKMIVSVLIEEMKEVMKSKETFDDKRYKENLNKLL